MRSRPRKPAARPVASPIGRFVSRRAGSRSRWRRALARVASWLLVLAVSLILLFLLLAFFEARDRGETIAWPGRSLSMFPRNGARYVVRCPAMAIVPPWPGSGVSA